MIKTNTGKHTIIVIPVSFNRIQNIIQNIESHIPTLYDIISKQNTLLILSKCIHSHKTSTKQEYQHEIDQYPPYK